MLLYHFPLNTQESIENFTNKGIKNDWYYKDNYRQTTSANGKISNICCLPNESRVEIPINSDTFTLAFRVFLSTDTSVAAQWRTFISIVHGTTRATSFLIYSNLTYYYWHAITDCRITQLNKWCDVVLVVDKGKYTGYFNGVKTGNTVTISGNVDKITLYGRNGENGYKFNLPNQDIRIYDYALSQAEINEYSRALVVHYPLNGNLLNSNVINDCSGLENDYTPSNISYQQDTPRYELSAHSTDTNIVEQMPTISTYTKAFWIKYNGNWKHLAITSTNVKYVDGIESADYDTIVATITSNGYDVSDYRVYATALSAEDIKNLYNSPISVSNQHQTMAFEFVEGNDGFSAKKNGIVQHNEFRENDSEINGCYNNKLITNELIEN